MPPPRDDVVSRAARMGLVPMVPDTSTKPRRELFIGNTPPNVTERMLIDHLNAAMATTKMATGPGPPVIQCRVSANFAFVELRSIEETDRALSLTGLPYLGYVLKVGRPSKYDGQATLCTTWQQMLQDGDYPTAMAAMGGGHSRYASGGGGPGSSSGSYYGGGGSGGPHTGGGGLGGGGGSVADLMMARGMPVAMDKATEDKIRRELFVGNTTPAMTETSIRAFLGLLALQTRQLVGPGDPIVSLRLSGHFAFVELRSIEETDALLRFNGVPFFGASLRIGRPSKFAAAGFKDDHADLRWEDTLDDFRKGNLRPLAATLPDPPLATTDIDDLALVSANATRTVLFRDVVDDERFPRDDDDDPGPGKNDPNDDQRRQDNEARRREAIVNGVLSDLRAECAKYGSVANVKARPNDKDVVVAFNLADSAVHALAALSYKTFDNRPLDLAFVPDELQGE